MDFAELKILTELSNRLTTVDITQIQNLIGIPDGLCEEISEGTNFLFALKIWNRHNAYHFYQALLNVKPELITLACKVPWLCVSCQSEVEFQENELTLKTLIELLKNEVKKGQWQLIYITITNEVVENVGFEMTLNKLLEKGFVQKDLYYLSEIMESIKRSDLVDKLKAYIIVFGYMEEGEFESKFKREVNNQAKELLQWELKLKEFLQVQYGTVKEIMGSDTEVNLADVYVELTILKGYPEQVKLEDETTYNEIAMLRKIAKEKKWKETIDFTEELRTYDHTKPEIWSLIGNPGCGKTFLAKRTALRFSSSELIGIRYSISIPCRNPDWHSMESTRYENELEIEREYISKWLCMGLPKGPNWSKDLAKHLAESDGEGLLLIIDGLDEFTRKVPFGKTFLCSLLTRQTLTKSTVILTSRPGAWTDISSVHELKIKRYYQVLGFSPENRDLYFKKQITNEFKLKACWNLMERHDEMKQLSLIPVNASLFAALLKGDDYASINTLSKLYYELTLYMIRRELLRMGLQVFSRVARISNLHEDVLDCLYRIGFIAFLGVANRDLASEENVPLIIGQEEYPSNCLGLAHEHYKKEAVGLIKKVWTFAHLTMQEFTAANWMSNNTWTEQCYSIRYISDSNDNFSLFRMVVRFLCGILSDKSAAILSIMHRYLTPKPIEMTNMPMRYQMGIKEYDSPGFLLESWKVFFEIYIQLTVILYETNSNSITDWFSHNRQFLPYPVYIYIEKTLTPNEWICFLQSLQLLAHIQLIFIDTKYINPKQFSDLIQKLKVCSVHYIALKFDNRQRATYTEILEYTKPIKDAQLVFGTKLFLDLMYCDLTNDTAVDIFSPNTNYLPSSLMTFGNEYSDECQQQIANQITALEYLRPDLRNCEIMLSTLCQATQLKGLYLFNNGHNRQVLPALPYLSNLQEIGMECDEYSLLHALKNLSKLTYLLLGKISSYSYQEKVGDTEHCANLFQLIFENRKTLRVLSLHSLKDILTDMGIFLNCIALCTNVVELLLGSTKLTSEDTTLWGYAVSNMKELLIIELREVSLYDSGFESLCAGLAYHPTFKKLWIRSAKLTSLSCEPLIQLLPTLTPLDELHVDGLDKPDIEAYKYYLQRLPSAY